MKKYRRIEVYAFSRRVTIVSGNWPRQIAGAVPERTDDEVSLNDSDACEPVEPDSPEGQLIIAEAVRSLERRLAPEIRAKICAGQDFSTSNRLNRNRLFLTLRSVYHLLRPTVLRFARKEK